MSNQTTTLPAVDRPGREEVTFCAECGTCYASKKIQDDPSFGVEIDVRGERWWTCSTGCARSFLEREEE